MELLLRIGLRVWMLVLAVLSFGLAGAASATATRVDDTSETTLEVSASRAFYDYLKSIDAGELAKAYEMVLDPIDVDLQRDVIGRLASFMRARQKQPVTNEGLIVRSSGPWAMVVYQYDTIVAGKTARVITTAWMLQWEGYWRQFIVAPSDEGFWDTRRSDYERLQKWFDEHAGDLGAA